jgi:hypothetical protein
MNKELYILGNNDHIFLSTDLDAWVKANQHWLPDFGIENNEIHNFRYELERDGSYSARLHIYFSPDADKCGSCDEEGITEGVCAHEWYEWYDLKIEELWQKN